MAVKCKEEPIAIRFRQIVPLNVDTCREAIHELWFNHEIVPSDVGSCRDDSNYVNKKDERQP